MLTQWLRNVIVPAQDPTLSSSSEAAITAGGQHSRGLHPSARIVELIADRLLDFRCPSSSGSSAVVVVSSSDRENDQEVDDKEAVVTQEEIATKIITSSSYDDDDDGGEERGADDNDHLRIISLAEVGRHADNDDAWMVIYDKVKEIMEE